MIYQYINIFFANIVSCPASRYAYLCSVPYIIDINDSNISLS